MASWAAPAFTYVPDPGAYESLLYSASLDLLVIGSRDYGPVGRLVHGSVARQLLSHTRCPLLILTRAAREGVAEKPDRVGEAVAC